METKTLSIPTNIPEQRIKDLLCNAIEGGSNYWCATIDRMGGITRKQAEYRHEVPFVEGGWLDVVDEADGKSYHVGKDELIKGLTIMAEKYPKAFADFMKENDDAETGDIFLQCCCFGEAIYG
jgi:hypothetical protein